MIYKLVPSDWPYLEKKIYNNKKTKIFAKKIGLGWVESLTCEFLLNEETWEGIECKALKTLVLMLKNSTYY